ncbi:cation transporter [Bariatricus sp. HCP28S3_E4]|uniref:cation transporter n=1 Tax=Bacillota TaxID=1239 RepID=UPI001915FE4E|nr:cation transporter [Streptococcus suis]MDD6847840.1 cation transporter [Oscillospiraceae bacterium]
MNRKSINLTQKQIENRALIVTTVVNAIITGAGIWMYFLTDLQMMFLDGFFSLIGLLSALAAVLISKVSKRSTKHYPHGLYFLEPLYAVFKSVLLIIMMVYAVVSSAQIAFNYFIHGEGQIMETAPLPLYGAVMAVLCLGLAFFNRSQYKKTNSTSTMLRAEAQTNLIDGLQSAAIGVAVLILQFIPLESTLGFLHYTGDFFVVTVLCIWSIKEPFVILFSAFRELTGGVTKEKAVCDAVVNATELGEDCFTVYKIGMKIKVCIPVNEKTESHIREKEKMLGTLRQNYESAEIEFVIR